MGVSARSPTAANAVPRPPRLFRSVTEGSHAINQRFAAGLAKDEEAEACTSLLEQCSPQNCSMDAGHAGSEGSEAPPAMLELSRWTTVDGYEPCNMCQWLGGDPNDLVAADIKTEDLHKTDFERYASGSSGGEPPFAWDSLAGQESDAARSTPPLPSPTSLCRHVTDDRFESSPSSFPARDEPPSPSAREGSLDAGQPDDRAAMESAVPSALCPPLGLQPLIPVHVFQQLPVGQFTWPLPSSAAPVPSDLSASAASSSGAVATGTNQHAVPIAAQPPCYFVQVPMQPHASSDGSVAQFQQQGLLGEPLQEVLTAAVPTSPQGTSSLGLGAASSGKKRQRAQSLEAEHDGITGAYRIWWVVDARKLNGSDREAVSSAFSLALQSGPAQFKMIIRPTMVSTGRQGSCFKKAKGKGSLEVRCLERMDERTEMPLRFRLAVGNHRTWGEEARGPVEHRFAERALYSLPEIYREWEFSRHVDRETQTFDVSLEILSGISGAWV